MIALAFPTHKLLVPFLLVLFLVAQGSLLFHHTELEAHATDEECEYCLHVSNLKHPFSASNDALFTSLPTQTPTQAIALTALIQRQHIAALARGPPATSLAI